MPTYRSLPDVEAAGDTSTGAQCVHTPWGMIAVRRDDVLVSAGNQVVPIPGDLWRRWFERADPIPPPKDAEPYPDLPMVDWSRRDLERYALEKHGVTLNRKARMSVIVRQVHGLVQKAPK